jgi:hypothetical protein
MGDVRSSGEMLPDFDRGCRKFRGARTERTATAAVLVPHACQRHSSDPANAAEGVAYFQIAKEN